MIERLKEEVSVNTAFIAAIAAFTGLLMGTGAEAGITENWRTILIGFGFVAIFVVWFLNNKIVECLLDRIVEDGKKANP